MESINILKHRTEVHSIEEKVCTVYPNYSRSGKTLRNSYPLNITLNESLLDAK